MSTHATVIVLTLDEHAALRQMIHRPRTEQHFVDRARIIEMAAADKATQEVATALHTRPARVSQWRTRFAARRLEGLRDIPRPGQKRKYDQRTCQPGAAGWISWVSHYHPAMPPGLAICSRRPSEMFPSPPSGPLRRASRAADFAPAPKELMHQHRPRICLESGGHHGTLPRAPAECCGDLGR